MLHFRPTRTRCLSLFLLAATVVAHALIGGGAAIAQRHSLLEKLAYVLDDEEAMTSTFRDADEALAKKKYGDVVEPMLQVLLVADDQVHPLGDELHTSVRLAAIQRLTSLPPQFVAAARKRRDVEAQALLAVGLRAEGTETLWRCVAHYPLTTAGAGALEALADRALERGDAGLSSRCLRRYLSTYRPVAAFAELPWSRVLAKLGAAAAAASDLRGLAAAKATATALDRDGNARSTTIGDTTKPLAEYLAALEIATPWTAPATRWPTLGGAPRRWRTPPLDTAPLAFRWIVTDRNIGNFDAGDEPRPSDRRFSCLQPVYPAVDGEYVHYYNGRILSSIELKTGETRSRTRFRDTNPADRGYQPNQFRHLSVGPRGLYLVGEIEPDNTNRVTQRGVRAYAFDPDRRRHVLRWKRGGPSDPDPIVAKARLTGNPLVVGDRVYLGGTVRGTDDRVFLFSFDAADGRLLWTRFLCAGAGERTDAKFQRVIGPDTSTDPLDGEINLAEHAGTIYASTNMGVIAAVARGDGELLWLNRYSRRWRPENPSDWPAVTPSPWLDNTIIVTPTHLLTTPRDSDRLHVLHLEPDRERGLVEAATLSKTGIDTEFLYLIGIDDGRVLLTERRWVSNDGQVFRILALGLDDERFESLWRFELPHVHLKRGELGEFPAGRALIVAGRLLVPTSKHVHILDTKTGQLVQSLQRSDEMKRRLAWPRDYEDPAPRGFGTLIPTAGGLLSALPSSLTWWSVEKPKSDR